MTAGVLAEAVDQPNDVADQVELGIGTDVFRCVGAAVAALVWCDNVVASLAEGMQLVSPRVPGLWEAVAENDKVTSLAGPTSAMCMLRPFVSICRWLMSATSVWFRSLFATPHHNASSDALLRHSTRRGIAPRNALRFQSAVGKPKMEHHHASARAVVTPA